MIVNEIIINSTIKSSYTGNIRRFNLLYDYTFYYNKPRYLKYNLTIVRK